MSYKDGSNRRNYRGRGKKSQRFQNAGFGDHTPDTGMLRPISSESVAEAGGHVLAEPYGVSESGSIILNDPFAPQTNTAEFARSLVENESTTVIGGIGGNKVYARVEEPEEHVEPAPFKETPVLKSSIIPRMGEDGAPAPSASEGEDLPSFNAYELAGLEEAAQSGEQPAVGAGGQLAEPEALDIEAQEQLEPVTAQEVDAAAEVPSEEPVAAEEATPELDEPQVEPAAGVEAELEPEPQNAASGVDAEADAMLAEIVGAHSIGAHSVPSEAAVADAAEEAVEDAAGEEPNESEVAPVAAAAAAAGLGVIGVAAAKAEEAVAQAATEAAEAAEPVVEAAEAAADAASNAVEGTVQAAEDAAGHLAAETAVADSPAAEVPVISEAAEGNEDAAEYSRESGKYLHRKGFSGKQRIALIVIAVVAVVLCALGGAAFAMWQNAQSNIALEDESIKDDLVPIVTHDEPYWVLILGSDTRSTKTEKSNSDVIMLARVDEIKKQVTLVSIPRDTKVELEGYGTQKINAAYALGGPSLAIQTVSEFSSVDISHYVEIYFKGFSKLVDQIGGVDVDVPEYASYGGVTLQPGEQHLDGKQALTFARNRKTYATGDFRRTECQRILVQAIAQKVLSQDITQIPSTIDTLSQSFSTDMPLGDILGLATSMQGISSDSFYSAMAPSDAGMLGAVSYTFTYINQWKLTMQRAKKGEDPKLDDTEKAICGDLMTRDAELDMSVGLPADIQQQIDDYVEEKAEKKAKKEAKKQKEAAEKAAEQAEQATSGDESSDAAESEAETDN